MLVSAFYYELSFEFENEKKYEIRNSRNKTKYEKNTKNIMNQSFRMKKADKYKCPECQKTTTFPNGTMKQLPLNRMLAELLEQNGAKERILDDKALDKILKTVREFEILHYFRPPRRPTDAKLSVRFLLLSLIRLNLP